MSASIAMVASGFGFTFIPQSLTVIAMPGVYYTKVADPQFTTKYAIAWRRWDRSPIIKHLLSIMSDEEQH